MITVVTSGIFDILTLGHIRLLKKARLLGGRLVVLMNSDSSVSILKGTNRPINDQLTRKEHLLALKWVDDVIIFDDTTPTGMFHHWQDKEFIYVKSVEYLNKLPEQGMVESMGGTIVFLNHENTESTTDLINRIQRIGK